MGFWYFIYTNFPRGNNEFRCVVEWLNSRQNSNIMALCFLFLDGVNLLISKVKSE